MTLRILEIDDAILNAAQQVLRDESIRQTVDRALRHVVANAAKPPAKRKTVPPADS